MRRDIYILLFVISVFAFGSVVLSQGNEGILYIKTSDMKDALLEGAEVFINEEYKGKTPLLLEDVAPGTYKIRITLSGYYDWERSVLIEADEVVKFTAKLRKRETKASLTILSDPLEAEVYINGELMGTTPLILSDLEPGTLKIKLVKDEYEYEGAIAVEAEAKTKVEFILGKKAPTKVTLTEEKVQPEEIRPSITKPIEGEMVYIPAGEFIMGSDKGDNDEKPQHTVYLDAFYIDKYEVTNAQYRTFMEAGGYDNRTFWTDEGWNFIKSNNITQPKFWRDKKFNQPNQPVVGVSWYEASAYARWAGKRLPTEAEWEKASRGTDGRNWPWGDEFISTYANTSGRDDGYMWPAEVGSYPQGESPYGVYDMAGNVWEWVADWYDSGYYSSSPSRNPEGPQYSEYKVRRGSSWDLGGATARCADRGFGPPNSRGFSIGFRCAKSK